MVGQIRQNYHPDCEAAINKLINLKLHASYVFLSVRYHYERDDVALPGFAKFFGDASGVEKDHAHRLMKYQNERGGNIVLNPIAAPPHQEWGCAIETLEMALDLKKELNQNFLELHSLSTTKKDPFTGHTLDDLFMIEHVDTIKKIGDMATKLRRVGQTGLGVHLFDSELQ